MPDPQISGAVPEDAQLHTPRFPEGTIIQVAEPTTQEITGVFIIDTPSGPGNVQAMAPVVPIRPPDGTNITVPRGNLVATLHGDDNISLYVLKTLDLLLSEEAREQVDKAHALAVTTVDNANRKKRALATAVLTLQAALHARAYRILQDRYRTTPENLESVPFAGMWKRVRDGISQDRRVTVERKRLNALISDIEHLYDRRHIIAHYLTTDSFDEDIKELDRLIERGFMLIRVTEPLIATLRSRDD